MRSWVKYIFRYRNGDMCMIGRQVHMQSSGSGLGEQANQRIRKE